MRKNFVDYVLLSVLGILAVLGVLIIVISIDHSLGPKQRIQGIVVQEVYEHNGTGYLFREDGTSENRHLVNINGDLIGKYNMAQIAKQIEEGKHYYFTIVGQPVLFLDVYPNIVSVDINCMQSAY